MIKIDDGNIQVAGDIFLIASELSFLIKDFKRNFGEEFFSYCVDVAGYETDKLLNVSDLDRKRGMSVLLNAQENFKKVNKDKSKEKKSDLFEKLMESEDL